MVLEHSRFRQYFQPITTGVSVPHISKKQVGNFEIPLPEKKKQEKILNIWDDFRQGNDRLIRLSNQSINLLREKRQALINAAVTGQIDVSDE
jgi:type I restriction enzyme S subunit